METICPSSCPEPAPVCPPTPPICLVPCKSSIVLKVDKKCATWCSGAALCWNAERLYGESIFQHPQEKGTICLQAQKRYCISLDVKAIPNPRCDSAVCASLQVAENNCWGSIYTAHKEPPCNEAAATLSAHGIITDTFYSPGISFLALRSMSAGALIVESAVISIMEL